MSKKLHSGLKRTLAWMLVVALMVQGCMVVYADDFSSEPEAVVSDESSDEDASAESDLEITEDEDTSADVEVSEDSDEDMDSDVTVEEEQEDEAGVDAFSDGNDVAAFSDGTEAVETFTANGNDVELDMVRLILQEDSSTVIRICMTRRDMSDMQQELILQMEVL